MVLGVQPEARYHQDEAEIHSGDLLVVFSDGITEAANAKAEEFGEGRLLQAIQDNWENSSGEICGAILDSVRSFIGGQIPHDDETVMVVRPWPVSARRPSNTPEAESIVS